MSHSEINMPLNAHQIEILKLFSRKLNEEDFIAIKKLIVQYLGNKVSDLADDIWNEKGWTNEDMEKILNTHKRTPYNSNN